MLEALRDGTVSAYVTDFPTEELIQAENVVPIPHLGASTPESEDNCAAMASSQVQYFLETGNIVNSVNFPNCEMPKSDHLRITVAHRNVPNMVGQIASHTGFSSYKHRQYDEQKQGQRSLYHN